MSKSKSYISISSGQGNQAGDGNIQINNYYTNALAKGVQEGENPEVLIKKLLSPSLLEQGRLWNVPFPPNPFFTGREEILQQLEQSLFSNQKSEPAQTQAAKRQSISGLGGIGKTQTAVEYAYRHREQYRAVFWAQADTTASLDIEFGRIATLLGLPEKDAPQVEQIRAAVKNWLATEQDYLLILDNAETADILKVFLPPQSGGHLLLTSRGRSFGKVSFYTPVEVSVLPPEEAIAFLLKRTNSVSADVAEYKAASDLAKELGGLPLALEQAGAYIVEEKPRFADYLTSYRRRKLSVLEAHEPETGDYDKTVATTWSLNFEAVEQKSEAAAELLRLSAFLRPEQIPEELLTTGSLGLGDKITAALQNVVDDPLEMNNLLAPLARYSLIQRDSEMRTYDIHRLVQAVIQYRMHEHTRRLYAERVVEVVSDAFPEIDYSNWSLCERLLSHALLCVEQINIYQFVSFKTAHLLSQAGYYLKERALYTEAEPLLQRALTIKKKVLGLNHPDTANSFSNLALLYSSQGRYTEAEPLYKRALTIFKTVFDPDHPATATSLNNLALLYNNQGRYIEAELLHKQALAIREAALEPNHPDIANSLNSLAGLYNRHRKYAEAEPLYKRALAIRETVLGQDDPLTANILNNLATLYNNQGRYFKVEPLYKRALAIRETVLGPDHPATATSLSNLADLYRSQGKYVKAELLFQRALTIQKKVLGLNHPDTASSLNGLALLYKNQGRYVEAEPLYKQALTNHEAILGQNHLRTATSLNNLAILYDMQGIYAEAEPLYKRALTIRETVLGPNHPDTITLRRDYRNLQTKILALG